MTHYVAPLVRIEDVAMTIEVQNKISDIVEIVNLQRHCVSLVAGMQPGDVYRETAKLGIDRGNIVEPYIVGAGAVRVRQGDVAVGADLGHVAMNFLQYRKE